MGTKLLAHIEILINGQDRKQKVANILNFYFTNFIIISINTQLVISIIVILLIISY